MPFIFNKLSVPDIVLIEPKIFGDERGYFLETYKNSDFVNAGIRSVFVQANESRSSKNVLRGMHYQLNPYAQAKLVRVIEGEIFDVGVDVRKGSPSYGKWAGEMLTSENKRMLYIPEGFAHGFCVLSDVAVVEYLCTGEYAPAMDRGFFWNDPAVGIKWPVASPMLSEKDSRLPLLASAENNFKV